MRLTPYLLATAAAATLVACSLLVDAKQCASDRDCVTKGNAFAGTVCASGLCITAGSNSRDASANGEAGPPVDECASTAECISANGAHSVCLDGVGRRCATLTSKDCARVIGDDKKDNPLLVGMLVDTKQEASDDAVAGAALALNDFQQAIAGVPSAQGMAPRPLVLVVCAEQDDALRAARHLIDTLAVPAIIGPTSSARLLEVAEKVAVPGATLLVSPAASSQQISVLLDQSLVFRSAPSDALEGKVLGLVASGLANAGARVATVYTDDDRGHGLRTGLESSLSLNGKSLAANKKSGAYVSISLAPTPSDKVIERAASDVVAARPNLVLLAGGPEQAVLIAAIEAAWPSSPSSPSRPSYVLAASVPSASFLDALREAPQDRLSRIRVVFPDNGRSPVFQAFRRLFASSNAGTRVFEAAKAYDAMYVVALAAIPGLGANAGPGMSGREMADAISAFLIMGDPVEVGSTSLPGVAARLSVQSIVDLEGASGPLEFDHQGDVETNIEVGCLLRSAAGRVTVDATEVYYRASTSASAGTLLGRLGPCQ